VSLASAQDVLVAGAELRQAVAECRVAVSTRLDRAVRRTVLMLSTMMVVTAAVLVLVAWSGS
jgi:hypothetical protein